MSKPKKQNRKRPSWRPGKPKPEQELSAWPAPTEPLFERWAAYISRILEQESELIGAFLSHGTTIGNAREALIKGVLERFLPPIYEIGTGKVVDAYGGESKQIDIIIARKDFPALRFADGSAQYMVESVLATIEVKSAFDSKSLKTALDNCHSVGTLQPSFNIESLEKTFSTIEHFTSRKLEIRRNRLVEVLPDGTTRDTSERVVGHVVINMLPETYIYSFRGYSEGSAENLAHRLKHWIDTECPGNVYLHNLPVAIALKGCVAFRNQFRESINDPDPWPMMYVKNHPNSLGFLVSSLLRQVQHSVAIPPKQDGLLLTMDKYIYGPVNIGDSLVINKRRTRRVSLVFGWHEVTPPRITIHSSEDEIRRIASDPGVTETTTSTESPKKEGEDLSPPLETSSPSDG